MSTRPPRGTREAREDGLDEFFRELFTHEGEADLSLPYAEHPPEGALRAVARGRVHRLKHRAWVTPERALARLRGESQDEAWSAQEVALHVLTCRPCRERVRALQAQRPAWAALTAPLGALGRAVARMMEGTPRPARAALAVQTALIIGLGLTVFALLRPGPASPSPPPSPTPSVGVEPKARSGPGSDPDSGPASSPRAEPPLAQGRTSGRAGEALGDPPLPPPALRAIQTLTASPDPQTRLTALQQLQRYPDPRLVEPLAQVYERERHPEVRRAVAQAIAQIVQRTESHYAQALRALERLRAAPDPTLEVLRELNQTLRRFWEEFRDFSLEMGSSSPSSARTLRCTAPSTLTLARLEELLRQVGTEGPIAIVLARPPGAHGSQLQLEIRLPAADADTRTSPSALEALLKRLSMRCL